MVGYEKRDHHKIFMPGFKFKAFTKHKFRKCANWSFFLCPATINCLLTAKDDICEVVKEVTGIQSNYYQFGIELGLPLNEMDAVQKAYRQDIPLAFTEVLKIFLKHCYNTQKYGPPTWRKLVEAVDSRTGGNNHALAKKIAEHHPVNKGRGNGQAQVTKSHPFTPEGTPVDKTTNAVIETSVDYPRLQGSWQLNSVCKCN